MGRRICLRRCSGMLPGRVTERRHGGAPGGKAGRGQAPPLPLDCPCRRRGGPYGRPGGGVATLRKTDKVLGHGQQERARQVCRPHRGRGRRDGVGAAGPRAGRRPPGPGPAGAPEGGARHSSRLPGGRRRAHRDRHVRRLPSQAGPPVRQRGGRGRQLRRRQARARGTRDLRGGLPGRGLDRSARRHHQHRRPGRPGPHRGRSRRAGGDPGRPRRRSADPGDVFPPGRAAPRHRGGARRDGPAADRVPLLPVREAPREPPGVRGGAARAV